MAQAATITFAGMLGTGPELRYTPGGNAVATINVAVGERRLNTQTGEWENAGTSWFRVTAWNKLAEYAAESLEKGSRVMVTGTIRQSQFTDREGSTRYAWDVTADEIGVSLKFGPVAMPGDGATRSPAGTEPGHGDPWAAAPEPPAGSETEPTESAPTGPTATARGRTPRHAGKRGQTAPTSA